MSGGRAHGEIILSGTFCARPCSGAAESLDSPQGAPSVMRQISPHQGSPYSSQAEASVAQRAVSLDSLQSSGGIPRVASPGQISTGAGNPAKSDAPLGVSGPLVPLPPIMEGALAPQGREIATGSGPTLTPQQPAYFPRMTTPFAESSESFRMSNETWPAR